MYLLELTSVSSQHIAATCIACGRGLNLHLDGVFGLRVCECEFVTAPQLVLSLFTCGRCFHAVWTVHVNALLSPVKCGVSLDITRDGDATVPH